MATPPKTRTICVDELGPLSAKTYPGSEWVRNKSRATFEPSTGEATFVLSSKRDSASHIHLLEKIIQTFPADRLLIIEDNLSIHHSRDTKIALAAWPEIQILFLPKYACWLNLIEPWWKQLRSLALQGRKFENQTELENALWNALDYWNQHRYPYRWKKRPQEQLSPWDGFGFSKST